MPASPGCEDVTPKSSAGREGPGSTGGQLQSSRFSVVVHLDADAFLARAWGWLMEREDEHNLLLGLAAHLSGTPPQVGQDGYLMVTVEEEGKVVGAAFRTPPHKAGFTRMPVEAAPEVARVLATRYSSIPAFFGPEDVVMAAGRAWAEARGVEPVAGMPQRIYRLDRVAPPTGVPGIMRPVSPEELPLVHLWADGFARDAGAGFATARETRERWVAHGGLYFWEDGGAPVTMALATGKTDNGIRIGYVYTPRDHRRRGYATALVVALSQKALDEGARFCVLYTDLTNPTSNAIYPRVGYRPLCDIVDVDLVTPGT